MGTLTWEHWHFIGNNEMFNVTTKYITVVRSTQIPISEVIRPEVYSEYSQSAFTFQSTMEIPEQYTKYVQS